VDDNYLDLRGFACPINFVKCCLALENLSSKEVLKVDLDIGEAETSVTEGLTEKGYIVKILKKDSQMITLKITSDQN
tara:strand:+ start:467 stop:697 length:231 start_codon:yes stop_codon:yes gene_type:complete